MATNPGSAEAKRLGCTCPVLDNAYGKGAVVDGKVDPNQFFTDPDCAIHRDRRLVDDGPVGGGEGDSVGSTSAAPVAGDDSGNYTEAEGMSFPVGEGAGVDQLQEDLERRGEVPGDRTETPS